VQLVLLILVAVILLEDRMPTSATLSPWPALLVAAIPCALGLLLLWFRVRRVERAMDQADPRGARAFDHADRTLRAIPWIALLSTATATLGFGWLQAIRAIVGDWPAIDELLALAPALTAIALSWWIYEPIERRVREASMIRRLDEGLPIATSGTRLGFVIGRIRSNILLLLAPLLAVMTLSELVEPRIEAAWPEFWAAGGREIVTLSVAAFVYLFSPLLARGVLQLEPVPAGELRDDLQAVCDGCGVRVRQILVWRTDHGMVNGAVMGLVAPLRFVMLTDGLLELLPRDELRAVMAHEIGHVRRRHLPWMLATLVALLVIGSFAVDWPVRVIDQAIRDAHWDIDAKIEAIQWLDRGAVLGATIVSLGLFGWVSRRIERQADSFAVQYLSSAAGSPSVTPGAVAAMSGALGSVARYAGVSPRRFSWRHGSIRWRQEYLGGLVGLPTDRLRIDRVIAFLKIGVALVLVAFGVLLALDARAAQDSAPAAEAKGKPGYHDRSRLVRAPEFGGGTALSQRP
jgi:Zn-dependent protease with chaperone function